MTLRRSMAPLVAVVASLALLVPAASAAVPTGQYECFGLGFWFKLKGNDKYKVQTGGGGKYAAKGKVVKFKDGPMNFAYGKLRKDQTGAPVIDLYDVGDDSYYDSCPLS